MRCKPLGSSNVYTGKATLKWLHGPQHHSRMDDEILHHTNVQNRRVGVRDQTNLIWFIKFVFNIDGFLVLFQVGTSSIGLPKILHIQFVDVQSWVLRELWLIFGGGENKICHVVYACNVLANDVCYRARVFGGPRIRSWRYVTTSMMTDSHLIRTCECIERQSSL